MYDRGSTIVIRTFERRSFFCSRCAVYRPTNPPPTIRIRGVLCWVMTPPYPLCESFHKAFSDERTGSSVGWLRDRGRPLVTGGKSCLHGIGDVVVVGDELVDLGDLEHPADLALGTDEPDAVVEHLCALVRDDQRRQASRVYERHPGEIDDEMTQLHQAGQVALGAPSVRDIDLADQPGDDAAPEVLRAQLELALLDRLRESVC